MTDKEHERRRMCAGWAGCHDGNHLLSLRVAVHEQRISPETAQAAVDYQSPVPLFASGAEAAAHGRRDIQTPGSRALQSIAKIQRMRTDLVYRGTDEASSDVT